MFVATANEIQKRTIGFFTPLGNFDAIDACTLPSGQTRFIFPRCKRNKAFQKKSEKKIQNSSQEDFGRSCRKKFLHSVDLTV